MFMLNEIYKIKDRTKNITNKTDELPATAQWNNKVALNNHITW